MGTAFFIASAFFAEAALAALLFRAPFAYTQGHSDVERKRIFQIFKIDLKLLENISNKITVNDTRFANCSTTKTRTNCNCAPRILDDKNAPQQSIRL